MSYITLEQMQALLNNDDPEEAADLNWAIGVASKYIDTFCGRTFGYNSAIVDKIVSKGSRFLLLDTTPVETITSIVFDGDTIPSADYELYDSKSGVIFSLVSEWEKTWRNDGARYIVTYAGGYVLPGQSNRTLPEDIEMAASLLAKDIFMTRMENASVQKRTIPQVITLEYFSPMNSSNGDSQAMVRARSLLKPYCRRNVI